MEPLHEKHNVYGEFDNVLRQGVATNVYISQLNGKNSKIS